MSVEDLGYCTFVIPSGDIFSSLQWKDRSIFSIANIKTFSLNLPSTYPAWKINGEMISGLLTPYLNHRMCYPNDLFDNIRENWIIVGNNIEEVYNPIFFNVIE